MSIEWIEVEDVKEISAGHWCGEVMLPSKRFPTKILMYLMKDGIRAIPRMCPHQSYDLIGSPLQNDGIRCGWHGMFLSLVDKKTSFDIKREGQAFFCMPNE